MCGNDMLKREATPVYFGITGVGMQWGNFYRPVNVDDELTMLYMWLIMLFDAFICFVIVWYVENIKPGDFGVPKPWYFPFTVSIHDTCHGIYLHVYKTVDKAAGIFTL